MKLSILIATTFDRSELFNPLYDFISSQIKGREVEICFIADNKEMSIGRKRQLLLEQSKGEWIVFFDDDDMPSKDYVSLILAATAVPGIDCMGIRGSMTTNGSSPKTWCHRLGRTWCENREGFDYIRPIIHFNPVKRELALKAGFKDIRFGEDKDYADRLNMYLTKEYYIDAELFHYRYSTQLPHKQKYGIK